MALIIKELYIAEFGGIKDKKIEFNSSKAMNIIYGENESGKSTIFLFIKFMLYGLQRKSQSNTERERSLSWSGSVASGSLTLEHNGKLFRIERSFSDRARGEKLVILSLDGGVPISTDRTPGEYFLGVPREVFESSACVGQMRSGEINGEKTAQVLSNMLSSADEGVDTAAVLKDLNAIRISYLHKNQVGGSLYEDEAKINSLSMKLEEAKNASLAIEGNSENFDKIKREYEELKLDLEQKDALVSQFNKIALIKRFEALGDKENDLHEIAKRKEAWVKDALKTDFFPDRMHVAEIRSASRELSERQRLLAEKTKVRDAHKPTFDQALAEAGERAEQNGGRDAILAPCAEAMKKAGAKVKHGAIFGAFTVAAAAASAIGFALMLIVGIIASFVALGLAFAAVAMLISGKKVKSAAIRELEALADSYDTTPEGLSDRIDEAIGELSKMRAYNTENAKIVAELEIAEDASDASTERAYRLLALTLGAEVEPSCEALDEESARLERFLEGYDAITREEDSFVRMLENEKNVLSRYDESKLRSEITVRIEDATPEAVEEAERNKSFLLAKRSAYENKINLLQNELIALRIKAEDPMPIADRLAALKAKNAKDREFYEALLLAMNVIEDSSAAIRGNVTPVISKTASEFMARISADKYNVLRTSSRLGVMLDKEGFGINSEYLSAGTRDAAYLSLRMALIMQIYENEYPPVIFDESLCQLDDVRLSRTVELLGAFAKEGMQIILLTSHKREAEACKALNLEYNDITL